MVSLLGSLPDELLAKIFAFSDEEDRRLGLSCVNRRFRRIYKANRRTVFHLQGHTRKLLVLGLEHLLNSEESRCTELMVSYFDFGQIRMEDEPKFNEKSLDSYIGKCCASNSITSITFHEVILDTLWLIYFRRLFPKLTTLKIERCSLISRKFEPVCESISPLDAIKNVHITLPLLSNLVGTSVISWLLDYCVAIDRLQFQLSEISQKRPVSKRLWRRYCGMHKRGQRPIIRHISRDAWESVLEERKDSVKYYDRDTLSRYPILEADRVEEEIRFNQVGPIRGPVDD